MPKTYIFCDQKSKTQALTALFPHSETVIIGDAPERALLENKTEDTLVFALPNHALQRATAVCRGLTFAQVYAYPYDLLGNGDGAPIPIDASKPRLDYMETEISHVCNLNCRGCCDFSNLGVEKGFYDFDVFCADLRRMKELFWGIAKIRLMGGEPLLNPRLAEYVEQTRAVFPDADLRIVSNGLLIPTLKADVLTRIKNSNCNFDISNYPPTRQKKQEITATLEAFGIGYDVGFPMNYFFKNILEKPVADPAPAYKNCIFTHCHMMAEGVLAPCSYAYCIHRFNKHFGTDYPEDDHVKLADPQADGWRIIDAFSKPHPFCKCCGSGILPIKWQGRVRAADAKPGDWLIRESFVNTTVAPLIQRTLKPAAVKLRSAIQKRET